MSIARICDCGCHEDGYVIDDILDSFDTFDDRDICQSCLTYCTRWQGYDPSGRVISQMERAFQSIYDPVIKEALSADPLFRKIKKERDGSD